MRNSSHGAFEVARHALPRRMEASDVMRHENPRPWRQSRRRGSRRSFASASSRAPSTVPWCRPGRSAREPREGTPRTAARPQGTGGQIPSEPPPLRPRGEPDHRGPSSPRTRIAAAAPGTGQQSGDQDVSNRRKRVPTQSSRAGPPRSFRDSFRSTQTFHISAASRGTTSTQRTRGATASSRSTTVKGSPSASRYFSRSEAGRVTAGSLALGPGSSWSSYRRSSTPRIPGATEARPAEDAFHRFQPIQSQTARPMTSSRSRP